jgi:hypothetical protein
LVVRWVAQTVPLKLQGIGCHMDTSPLPFTATLHNNAIESLWQEFLGKINGQADDICALQSSNAKLKLKVNGLMSKVNGLTLSNAVLISSNAVLTSKVNCLTSSNAKLTLSNVKLLEKVHSL